MSKRQQSMKKRSVNRQPTTKLELNDAEDDYNLNNAQRRRLSFKRATQNMMEARKETRIMNIMNTKLKVNNLENELELQKRENEKIEREKNTQQEAALNQMNELQSEQMKLLKKADEKSSHIQSI